MLRPQVLGSSRLRWLVGVLMLSLALVPVADMSPAAATAPPNAHFTLGLGEFPDIAIAADGTAHVAWVHSSSPGAVDQIQYCRVPRGGRRCAGLTTFILPGAQIGQRPYVFLPGGNAVWLVTHRCCFTPTQSPYIEQTLILRSTDGGRTFGAPQLIGTHSAQGDAQLGPDGTLYTITDVDTLGVTVQRDALDGSAVPQPSQKAGLGGDEYGGSLAVTGSTVLAAHWDFRSSTPPSIHVSRYSGVGDPNADASWSTVFTAQGTGSPRTGGSATELASGRRGIYLFSQDNEVYPRFQIRKWNGSTFSAPTNITPAEGDIFPSFWEDASGRLSVAYSNSARHMTYRSSGLHGFATAVTLRADRPFNLRGATAADGGGFVAYDNDGGGGGFAATVSIVPIPVSRVVTETVSGTTLSGAVAPFRAGQPVVLQKATARGWVAVTTHRLTAPGRFSFRLPAARVRYRAVAPATEGYAEGDGRAVRR